jgi:hypothetical protein
VHDQANQPAEEGLRDFVASMAGAGNSGSGKHLIGLRKVDGSILEYDPTVGGSEVHVAAGPTVSFTLAGPLARYARAS